MSWHLVLNLTHFLLILTTPSLISARKWQEDGINWALLVAGSNEYENYRHQADVCHAYQILKRGGLKDENIVVFMYDDIANHKDNPKPGVIINRPQGNDVYAGVPKDYTGVSVTASNVFAVLLGDKESVIGGSGKIIASGPNDRIFVYYSGHGGPGTLGMPDMLNIYANDFIEVLDKKYASGSYKEMVIYVESCLSGSIFEGLLKENMNIYVTTAANAEELSWATYCPGANPPIPREYNVCLGDLYSVSWMEDSDEQNSIGETLEQQYEKVKARTYNNNSFGGSHVMQYGTMEISTETISLYQGFGETNVSDPKPVIDEPMGVINQRDADLVFFQRKYEKLSDGSQEKADILKQITDIRHHRSHLDSTIYAIGTKLFGPRNTHLMLTSIRGQGKPLVDDWGCLKSMVRVYEMHCGSLTQYGMKHMRAFANICNNKVSEADMASAALDICGAPEVGQ